MMHSLVNLREVLAEEFEVFFIHLRSEYLNFLGSILLVFLDQIADFLQSLNQSGCILLDEKEQTLLFKVNKA